VPELAPAGDPHAGYRTAVADLDRRRVGLRDEPPRPDLVGLLRELRPHRRNLVPKPGQLVAQRAF
jgi:hypothetical protein